MNDVIKQDLPKQVLSAGGGGSSGGGGQLGDHEFCVALANEPAMWKRMPGHKLPYVGNRTDISYYHQAFLMKDGQVYMTGQHSNYTLAQYNSTGNIDTWKAITHWTGTGASRSLTGKPIALCQAYDNTMVLTDAGDVAVWGYNGHGQLGHGNTSAVQYIQNLNTTSIGPRSSDSNQIVTKIDITRGYPTASNSLYAMTKSGQLWAWGYNGYGQLGQNNTSNYSTPVRMYFNDGTLTSNIYEFAAGGGDYQAVYALKEDGTLWACGQNSWGKLAVGNTSNQYRLAPCTGLPSGLSPTDYVTIAPCGGSRGGSIGVLLKDGRLFCAGYGGYNQCGTGTSNYSSFQQVNPPSGAAGFTRLWGGQEYSSFWVMTDDNRLFCVGGYNGQGQLGVGNTTTGHMRTCMTGWLASQYIGDKFDVVELSTGGAYAGAHYHTTVMLANDGHIYSTGVYGGYGNGGTGQRTTFGRWTVPLGFYHPAKVLASGAGGAAYANFESDMRKPRDSSGQKLWEPVGLTAHSYTSEYGAFVRLKNGMVFAAGRNTTNKLGTSNYRDGSPYPSEPQRVRLGV